MFVLKMDIFTFSLYSLLLELSLFSFGLGREVDIKLLEYFSSLFLFRNVEISETKINYIIIIFNLFN